jgi:DNA helicase-2/ATP-dependent DNA helicase PcrA
MNFLAGLNEHQREAVLETEGYVRVVAGAGSGKTRALTARYAYLVEELGVPPENILCVTFTNKAAREMRNRLRSLLGDGIDISFVSTLHSFCVRVLKEDINKLHYPESFVILDTADQKNILEEIYEELGIKMDTATFEFMVGRIRDTKNKILYDNYMVDPRVAFGPFDTADMEKKVIIRYMEKQKKYFGLDFFDIINFTVHLFKIHEDVLQKWQNRLHYVMVDEFQDTNNKELRLYRILTDVHQNLFVVGDPDQNIYEWRRSFIEFFVDFEKYIRGYFTGNDPLPTYWPDHPIPPLRAGIKTIFMNRSYRCTPEIIAASNSLISKNKDRIKKELYTENKSGPAVAHVHAKNDGDEIGYIAAAIQKHAEGGGKYSDIAILYRSAYVSRFIEQGLLKHNIPYTVFGGVGFFERKEIKDVLSYLRLVACGDDLSFRRVVNVPRRNMGKAKLAFLTANAEKDSATLYDTLKKHIGHPVFKGSGARKFIQAIEDAKGCAETVLVSELFQKVLTDTGYDRHIRENGEMDRLDNISELKRSVAAWENSCGERLTLSAFLQEVTLGGGLDEDDGKDRVKIMTCHIAKGLEFDTVFVAGLSEKTFPAARALEERKDAALEEERRLAYVAMTRAKKRLTMTESEGTGFRGYAKTPSRFLFDIEDRFISRIGSIDDTIMAEQASQTVMRKPSASNHFAVGETVKHKLFGEGVIETLNERTKYYTIRFLKGTKPIRFDYPWLTRAD